MFVWINRGLRVILYLLVNSCLLNSSMKEDNSYCLKFRIFWKKGRNNENFLSINTWLNLMVFVPVKGKYHLQEETLKGNFGLLNQCSFVYIKYNLLSTKFDITFIYNIVIILTYIFLIFSKSMKKSSKWVPIFKCLFVDSLACCNRSGNSPKQQ